MTDAPPADHWRLPLTPATLNAAGLGENRQHHETPDAQGVPPNA